MRFDYKTGEWLEFQPKSICNFETALLAAGMEAAGAASAAATISGVLEVSSLALGGISAISQGNAAKSNAQFQQAQVEQQAQLAQRQAEEAEADRRDQLNRTLKSNLALAAGRFDTSGSRSFLAVQRGAQDSAERDIGTIRQNAANQQTQFGLEGKSLGIQGSSAQLGGFVKGAGSLLLAGNAADQAFSKKKASDKVIR
jgi:hypothetical protein